MITEGPFALVFDDASLPQSLGVTVVWGTYGRRTGVRWDAPSRPLSSKEPGVPRSIRRSESRTLVKGEKTYTGQDGGRVGVDLARESSMVCLNQLTWARSKVRTWLSKVREGAHIHADEEVVMTPVMEQSRCI